MSTFARTSRSLGRRQVKPGFHIQMVYACTVTLLVSFVGCWLTSTQVLDVNVLVLGFAFAFIAVLPLALYLREKGMIYLFDSVMTIFWAIFFTAMLGYPATVAARLFLGIPLQDAHFIELDRWVGVNVSNISAWASHHWLGNLVNRTYALLFPLMQLTILLPILMGKVKYSQKFITGNLVAFAIGLPFFALLPGIGPWYGFHLAARPDQADCTALVTLIRQRGPYLYSYPSGVICFPSFHVVWAVLCTYALWGFRLLRIPVCFFSALIVISTLTIGNHYLCDVIAGAVLVAVTIVITERLSQFDARPGSGFVDTSIIG